MGSVTNAPALTGRDPRQNSGIVRRTVSEFRMSARPRVIDIALVFEERDFLEWRPSHGTPSEGSATRSSTCCASCEVAGHNRRSCYGTPDSGPSDEGKAAEETGEDRVSEPLQ
jgi:hypothetical protein